ncbi:MAG: hypothetical protein K9J37_01435 [Saprospiraceae bacterium]|nr:hypothetical protein [Saprospiraceae bacterium]MCF8248538.1 hypothetical protein [Saprospiraceae bacterium]MCF8310272.1 hypothetical protein [Saprospiraceae bacterium]MCF8439289.1 hypothetical protein [Saprospiraceae bacterium]
MKKFLFLFLIAATAFSCKDDDQPSTPSTTVNINFKAVYDGAPLVLYQALDYPGGKQIRFQHFNFFVSNITLLGDGATPDHLLSEVEFFDFEGNLDIAAAQTALSRKYEKVPLGNYTGVQIDFGVPASLNNADSGKLDSSNPLRQAFSSHFWSDWGSFIFMKSEGIYDLNGDGVFNQSDQGFEHHPGTNQVLTLVTKLKPIILEGGVDFDLNLKADVFKIYVSNGVALDLSNPDNKDTQELTDMPLAIDLMSHWDQACSIED